MPSPPCAARTNPRGWRWFKVIRHDGSEVLVQAMDHTRAKQKGANEFIHAAGRTWPAVLSCRLQRGMNG